MPRGYPIGEITAYDNLMGDYWHAPAGREVVRDYFFQDNDRMPQYQMEAVLRNKLSDLPNVECHLGVTASAIEQGEHGVRVILAGADGASRAILEADYVVGCDGGHSIVRKQLGVEQRGTEFDQLMVLIVFRSRELNEKLKRFPDRSIYRVMHPALKGFWQFFGRIDIDEGWFFHAPVPADTKKEGFDFLKLIHRAVGCAVACEFDHVGFWDMRTAVAQQYRCGRVFIAGDAAHSHPPYGGFGLNNGLEDSVNLGWKLAAKLDGWGGDALLQSYDEERRPVFEDIAENFITGRIVEDDEFLTRYSPDRDRAEFQRQWSERESDISDRFQTYETNYEGSSVIAGPPNGVSSAHGKHMLKARAGHHLAPLHLSSGRNVFGELGTGFTLLAFGTHAGDAEAFERSAKRYGVPLKVIRDSVSKESAPYEASLILVRPDQFVAWVGNRPPDDPDALIAKVSGQAT